MDKLKLEAGFSLIELSFSIAIFATSLIIISSFFINNVGGAEQSLRYQALDLCRTTLEKYKNKSIKPTTTIEDYGTVSNSNYNSQTFKRKIDIKGDNLQKIKVTVFWQQRGQEQQISLTTLRSSKPWPGKKTANNSNQILKSLLTAKQELASYQQQEGKFPAWDQRSGTLKKVNKYYDKFTTSLTNSEQVAYRNPRFYNWWEEGYLLVYKQTVQDKFYCLTNQSGLFTIKAEDRSPQQILGDLVANSKRDQVIFLTHATKFWRKGDHNE